MRLRLPSLPTLALDPTGKDAEDFHGASKPKKTWDPLR